MSFPIDLLERRVVQVPPAAIPAATRALWQLGVSARCSEGVLMAMVRFGSKGAQDRAAIYLVEIRFSSDRREQMQWLTMCWQLPAVFPGPTASYRA